MIRSEFADWCKRTTRGVPGDDPVKTTPADTGWYARALLVPAWGPYPALYTDPLLVVGWTETWYQSDDMDSPPDRACVIEFPDGARETVSSSMVEVYQDYSSEPL